MVQVPASVKGSEVFIGCEHEKSCGACNAEDLRIAGLLKVHLGGRCDRVASLAKESSKTRGKVVVYEETRHPDLRSCEERAVPGDARVYLGLMLVIVRNGGFDCLGRKLVVLGDIGDVPVVELQLSDEHPHAEPTSQDASVRYPWLLPTQRNPAGDEVVC